jgi:hypothetical protein
MDSDVWEMFLRTAKIVLLVVIASAVLAGFVAGWMGANL